MDIKFLTVNEWVQNRQLSIEHISTNSMITDPLTKGLSPKIFHKYTAYIGVVSLKGIQFLVIVCYFRFSYNIVIFQLFQFMNI